MGVYNPNRPGIAGMEWVPIRGEPYPLALDTEVGHGFDLTAEETVNEARFYLNAEPPQQVTGQVVLVAIYPRGREAASGPVRRSVVPVDGGSSSGDVSLGGGAASIAAGLAYASDDQHVSFDVDAGTLNLTFDTSALEQDLTGKRVLNVGLLYVAAGQDLATMDGVTTSMAVNLAPSVGSAFPYATSLAGPATLATVQRVQRINLGEINPCWDSNGGSNYTATSERLPWRYPELEWLDTATGALRVQVVSTGLVTPVLLSYAALEILWCEEQRIMVGGAAFGAAPYAGPADRPYRTDDGLNQIVMRGPDFDANYLLEAGAYTVTVTMGDCGDLANAGEKPTINAVRQLYELPNHPGVSVIKPGRPDVTMASRALTATSTRPVWGETATGDMTAVATATNVLPHLALRPFDDYPPAPAVHVYGVSRPVAVWSASTVRQGIATTAGDGRPYPQIRFYARRFGGGSVPLTVAYTRMISGPMVGAGSYTTANSTSHVAPSVVSPAAAGLLVCAWQSYDNPGNYTVPGSMAAGAETDGSLSTLRYGTQVLGASGATGTRTATFSVSDSNSAVSVVASGSPAPTIQQALSGYSGTADVTLTTAGGTLEGWWLLAVQGWDWDISNRMRAPGGGPGLWLPVADSGDNGGASSRIRVWARRVEATGAQTVTFAFDAEVAANNHARLLVLSGVTDLTVLDAAVTQVLPSEFGGLPVIVDGWREVNARFDAPPAVLPGTVGWVQWSASAASVADQWQLLAADALGGSVMPDSNADATYEGGDGAAATAVEAGTTLLNADVTVLLAQDPPTLTGLAVAEETLPLAGIGLDCAQTPACVPNGVLYHRVSWDPVPYPAMIARDGFARDVTDDWDTADVGGAWTESGGTAADFDVDSDVGGIHRVTTSNGVLYSLIGAGIGDAQLTTQISWESFAVDDGWLWAGAVLRWTDASNHYYATLLVQDGLDARLELHRVAAGVDTVLAVASTPAWSDLATLVFQAEGSVLAASVLFVGSGLPSLTATATDGTHASGAAGVRSQLDPTVTNGAHDVQYRYVTVTGVPEPLLDIFGGYEVQRSDAVDGTWRTIAVITNPDTAEFHDFEARVGVASSYRVRATNLADFAGEWSAPVVHTLTAPGVTGGPDTSLLIFTSNERQDGSATLAYAMVWPAVPADETFAMVEAGWQELQRMQGRDYQVAYRPRERGGVSFVRTLLVQSAAVAPPVLDSAFRSLRDLAWEALSYVCVRTEAGDRWLATVAVPEGRISRTTDQQLAQVQVTEVTDTPSQVTAGTCEGMVSSVRTPVYAQTAYRTLFDQAGEEIDIQVRMRAPAWHATPHEITLISSITFTTSGDSGFALWLEPGGYLRLLVEDPTAALFPLSSPVPFAPGEMGWVRARWVRDNGGGMSQITYYTSTDGTSWTTLGTPATDPGQPTIVSTEPWTVGAYRPDSAQDASTGWTVAQVRVSGAGGTPLVSPDFAAAPPGTTSLVDEQGNTWELIGGGTCEQ